MHKCGVSSQSTTVVCFKKGRKTSDICRFAYSFMVIEEKRERMRELISQISAANT